MRINRNNIGKDTLLLNEVISFKDLNNRRNLISLDNISVKCEVNDYISLVKLNFSIKGIATLVNSFTGKPIDYKLDFQELVTISNDINDKESLYFEENEIDLNPIILDLIVGNIPTLVFNKGDEKPKDYDGVTVLTEDDFNKEKESFKSSPFDALIDEDKK